MLAKRLSVLVSQSEAAEISQRAADAGQSVSAYLRVRALGTEASENEADAMEIFDQLLDEMAARVDQANAGLAASLHRLDEPASGSAV